MKLEDLSEDLGQEKAPNMPPSPTSLRHTPQLHRAEPVRLQGTPRKGPKD